MSVRGDEHQATCLRRYAEMMTELQRLSPRTAIIIHPEEAETFVEGGYAVTEEQHEGRTVLVARRKST